MSIFTKLSTKPPYLRGCREALTSAWDRIDTSIQAAIGATAAYDVAKQGGEPTPIADARVAQLRALIGVVEAIQAFDHLDVAACMDYRKAQSAKQRKWVADLTASLISGGFALADNHKSLVLGIAQQHPEYQALKREAERRTVYHGIAGANLNAQQDAMIAELRDVERLRGQWWVGVCRAVAAAEAQKLAAAQTTARKRVA